ncbi:hypothetical protein VOI32_33015 [Paraburkholderia caribensis]|nr:hypothetical protein [Paraburkholderia caribensis]MCO4881000.1 hypothetical protein [Paraburkholderia caribensis]PTB25768.1 hypothetical protein C9I56_26525 [Paraburkholderia caribensis]
MDLLCPWSEFEPYVPSLDLLRDDPAMGAALAADIERLKPKLLTGGELDAARRREQLILLPAGFA